MANRTVDMTPSWQEAAAMLCRILREADNEATKDEAQKEVIRMGGLLDAAQAERKEAS